MIPFSRRELRSAWVDAYEASKSARRTNAHRLLLFYAAECGLKAAFLKRQSKEVMEGPILDPASEQAVQHDLNKLLDLLNAGARHKIPAPLSLPRLRGQGNVEIVRSCQSGQLNQAWRYGGRLENPHSDVSVEAALEGLHEWLQGELK